MKYLNGDARIMSAKAASMLKSWAPLATAVALFVTLIATSGQSKARLQEVRDQRDSTAVHLRRELNLSEELFTAGDSLAFVKLLTRGGDTLQLRELPARAKYLYFGRNSCLPCQILQAGWASADPAKLDSVVFITFHPDSTLAPDSTHNSMSWVHDATTNIKFVNRVPTVVVRSPDNLVTSAVHGSLIKATSALDMWGVIKKEVVERELRNARLSRGSADSLVRP